MAGYLEVRQWINVNQPAYAVALSGDGQYAVVGNEQGVAIYNQRGQNLLARPISDSPLPVNLLAVTPALEQVFIGARQGWLLCMETEISDKEVHLHKCWSYPADINSLTISPEQNIVAIGHLAPALTLLQFDRCRLWRRHPDDGTATRNQMWTLALDDENSCLYIGSAGAGSNVLAKINNTDAFPLAHYPVKAGEHVTGIAILSDSLGLVAVFSKDVYFSKLVAFDNALRGPLWEMPYDGPLTALASDPNFPLVVVSAGFEGQLLLLDAQTGKQLAPGLALASRVNNLCIVQGRTIAAVTQDGNLVLIHYQPEEFQL
jgi:hypothetical protein